MVVCMVVMLFLGWVVVPHAPHKIGSGKGSGVGKYFSKAPFHGTRGNDMFVCHYVKIIA